MRGEMQKDEELSASTSTSKQPELLVSAVLHLMSHYTVNSTQTSARHSTQEDAEQARSRLASVIERHLQALANLPDLAPVLQATCQQLSGQWAALTEKNSAQKNKTRKLGWLIGSHW